MLAMKDASLALVKSLEYGRLRMSREDERWLVI